jgi:hypothetical protein
VEGIAAGEPRAVGSELEGRHAVARPVEATRSRSLAKVAIVAGAIIGGSGLLVLSFMLGLHTGPVSTKTPEWPRTGRRAERASCRATRRSAVDRFATPGRSARQHARRHASRGAARGPERERGGTDNPSPSGPPASGPAVGGSLPASPPAPGAPPPSAEAPASPPPNVPMLNAPAPDSSAPSAPSAREWPPGDSSWSSQSLNEPPAADPGWPRGPHPEHRFNPGRRHYRPGGQHDQPEGPLRRAVSGLGGL